MGRPNVEINPLRGERLKIILKEQGKTQYELSQEIHLSQQSISKIIHGEANLTEDRVKQIIDLFPEYAPEWLLGYSDCKTLDEFEEIEDMLELIEAKRYNNFIKGIRMISDYCGYEAIIDYQGITVSPKMNSLTPKICDESAMEEFTEDITDFFKNRLKKLFERGH